MKLNLSTRCFNAFRRVAASLVVGTLLLPVVYADPPPWAPAWGYRHLHRHYHNRDRDTVVYVHAYTPPPPVYAPPAYATVEAARPCNNGLVGGMIGGAAGGFLGSQIGKGDGRLAATATGAVLGAVVGANAANSGCR